MPPSPSTLARYRSSAPSVAASRVLLRVARGVDLARQRVDYGERFGGIEVVIHHFVETRGVLARAGTGAIGRSRSAV